MRISQRQMFTQYLGHMNTSLSALMESNNEGGTGKKINRPSDDPAGMARVMLYRESLGNIERNKANINEATGWLNLADHALMQVSDIISKIKALNLQSATGTQNEDNRDQNATQLRGYYGELLNIANEKYNGQHIFAGHKVDAPAYVEGLAVTSNPYESSIAGAKVNLNETIDFVATGGNSFSTLIQFTSSDTLDNMPSFVYSQDGGKTWIPSDAGSWSGNPLDPSDPLVMDAGGVSITIRPKSDNYGTFTYPAVEAVTQDLTDAGGVGYAGKESAGGTWLTVRPTAIYKGDDHDTQTTQQYGVPVITDLQAEGSYTRDVSVRVTSANAGENILYEYSLDNGSTWIKGTAPEGSKQLSIPGGYLKTDTGTFAGGQEFLVHPRRADINFEISSNQTITVNNVGKDIFGGMYQEPFTDFPTTLGGANLFDTVGKLIGCCEINDQDGIQSCMDELTECLKLITTKLADVGGRENRLTVAFETATIRELSEDNARSGIEDVDTVTLMTKLAQQQLAYNTVLKSSSMIMQMSLMNFI